MKRCSKCGVEKTLSEFRPRPERPVGYRASCKACDVKMSADYKARHADKVRAYQKSRLKERAEATARYRARHYEKYRQRENELRAQRRDELRAADRERYAANRDNIRECKRQWRLRNLEAVREREARRRDENREARREASRRHCAKRRSTPKGMIENRIRAGINSRLKRGSKYGVKTFDLLGYSSEDLVQHLERQFTKGMNWSNFGKWHIDHIVPCSAFDFETPDNPDFRACWAITNLRPLWAVENLSKGAKRLLLA